jgi:cytidylate kinase
MIVTLDGPAGAGKSTAAKMLAQRLGFEFLDTGAMYRTVTLACLRAALDVRDQQALAQLLAKLRLEMPPGKVIMNGEDVTGLLRTAEVTAAAGRLAANHLVRHDLARRQRAMAAGRDMVCEGRDQGTVVFPDAACKFFLVADSGERARRRQKEMAARGEVLPWEQVLKSQEERDRRDAQRDLAPMVPAADAIYLDTTDMSLEEVVDRMEQEILKKRELAPADAPPKP